MKFGSGRTSTPSVLEQCSTMTPEQLLAGPLYMRDPYSELVKASARYVARNARSRVSDEALATLTEGPAVIACNHLDFFDPVLIGLLMREYGMRRPYFLAMSELFDPRLDPLPDFVAGWGAVPLKREAMQDGNRVEQIRLMRTVRYILDEGYPVVIFSEGGIHEKPRGYEHKVGPVGELTMRISRMARVPLIIAGLAGTRHVPLRSAVPFLHPQIGLDMSKVYAPDKLPANGVALQMSMQTSANVAKTLIRQH